MIQKFNKREFAIPSRNIYSVGIVQYHPLIENQLFCDQSKDVKNCRLFIVTIK